MKLLLIGAGNMGAAMLAGLQSYDISVVVRDQAKKGHLSSLYPNATMLDTIPPLDGYIVILAIKPQALGKLEVFGKAEGLISILAGTPLAKIGEKINSKSYIRAMPNIAAIKQKSVTSVCGDLELKDTALELMSSIGKAIWLDSQEQLDIATGIGGSAPAWMALVAEALSDGAVNIGLPRDKSYEYIAALMDGMGALLADEHPAILKDKVTSPAGTTIAGLTALEKGAVRDSFIEAVKVCYDRTKALS